MSASLATPVAGLPDYDYSQEAMPIMPDFNVTEFDVENLDRPAGTSHNHNLTDQDSTAAPTSLPSQAPDRATGNVDQDEALDNLLGALMSNQGRPNGDASSVDGVAPNDSVDAYVGQLANDLAQNNNETNITASRLPSFDATAANDLFTTDDYSQFNHGIEPPQTPIRQSTDLGDMAHQRRESLVSQQGMPRRPTTPQQREFAAFARLQFEDGSYYLNTYSCELGRDVLAYRAALQKEREEKEAKMNRRHGRAQSSSGGASGNRRRQLGSQIQGSVVSEQGGFAGIDEPPVRPTPTKEKPVSSQESESSVVKPAEYLINPQTMPSFDYHKSTELQAHWTAQHEGNEEPVDDEKPAAVTDAHLPNPNMCPLIPIHGKTKDGMTEAENHKKISRRHVKIQWNFERERWELVVQGRNGAFCDKSFVHWRGVVPLHDGSEIQIAHVSLRFRLPTSQQVQEKQQQPGNDQETMEVDADEALPSVEARLSETRVKEERRESMVDQKAIPKILLKPPQRPDQQSTEPLLGPDGLPIVKRRGPGRPPKDGIMSTRERKEREKAAKMAQLREQNGGKTPPPSARSKIVKPTPPTVEEARPEVKPEKRKYTKRKATDEDGPEEEGEGEQQGSEDERKNKKSRAQREKSESPVYPARESLTVEQLARPQDSYAILLHKMLMEVYPQALPLKDIYRMMKSKWPWFVYEATTEGWQSSVRHNLNSEYGKLFDKGDKEGKGFAWKAKPEAQPTADKKRTTQASVQRPRPPQQRPQFPPGPGQGVQWQQGTGTFPANGAQQHFINHGPWPPQGQPNATWPQDGAPVNMQQPNPQFTNGPASQQQQQTPSQTNQAGTPQSSSVPNQSRPPPSNGNNQAPPPPARQPPLPTSGSAASNMPCTIEGVLAIKRFEEEMYNQLDEKTKSRDSWYPVFMSAKKRVLHGYPESSLPGGETREEQTIMRHMQNFVNVYRNPNFKGFTITTRTPAPTDQEQTPVQAAPSVEASRTVSPNGASNGVVVAAQIASSAAETQEHIVNPPGSTPAATAAESMPSTTAADQQLIQGREGLGSEIVAGQAPGEAPVETS